MKKICLLGLGLVTSFSALAQTDLVKEVERDLKGSKPDYAAALEKIKPAMTDPTTSNSVMPYYLAGKAAFGVFDGVYEKLALGNEVTNDEKRKAGNAYVEGFEYYMQALPIDSLPNEKGKVKPQKSKEILNTLKGGHNYLNIAAGFLFDSGDYDNAFKALDLYISTPSSPLLQKNPPVALADTVRGQMLLAEAQALLLSDQENHDEAKARKALEVLDQIEGTGYNDMNTYVFGLIAARSLDDKAAKARFAQLGYDKFGTKNIQFIGELINGCLDNNDFQGALKYVDTAIAATDPSDAGLLSQLYNIKGVIFERGEKKADAVAAYEKAVELDPNAIESKYYLANMILSIVEEKQAADETLKPIDFKDDLLRAAKLIEEVYNADELRFPQSAYQLYSIYYSLGKDYVEQAKLWEQLK